MAYQTLTSFSQSLPNATGNFKVRVKSGANRPAGAIATGNFTATATITYNTLLTFASSTTDSEQGIHGTVASANANIKFEFNKIEPRVGLPQSLTIRMNNAAVLVIDYFGDYNGQAFRFTDAANSTHTGVFNNGTINF